MPIAVGELLHAPNGVGLLNVVVCPTHTVGVPVIGEGIGFTDNTVVLIQPAADVYVIIEVPGPTPTATPVVEPIVATDVVPLLHVPPTVEVLNVVDAPWQILVVPVMAAGNGITVNVFVVKQLLGSVYVIIVVPGAGVADTPPTTPDAIPTVPIAGVLLVHVPAGTAWVNVVVRPSHTEEAPVIATGAGVTVTT